LVAAKDTALAENSTALPIIMPLPPPRDAATLH